MNAADEIERLELAAIECDVAYERTFAENAEELQRCQQQLAELRKHKSWVCLYCGEETRDRSTAMLHPVLCETWSYRLEAERLQSIVGKLPKCWRLDASGKLVQDVPIVPPMEAWHITDPFGGEPTIRRVTINCMDWFGERWLARDWGNLYSRNLCSPVDRICNTREAAEAWLKQEQSKE